MARLKDLLNEETLKKINENILGEMPSSKLMKMKWNPITESEPATDDTTSVNEAMYTVIDPRGNHGPLAPKIQVQQYARKKGGAKKGYFVVASKNINKAKKLYGAAGGWQKSEKFQDAMWDLMYEGLISEGIKSNIMQKWDKEDVIMDDLRYFILKAKDAGGSDLLRGIADALKVMSNYATGEYRKSKR